jgi:hypothetical protein
MREWTHDDERAEIARVAALMGAPDTVFVFGANEAGRHGGGAALVAHQRWGAVWGVAFGLHGRSYAVPTKDRGLRTLPLDAIGHYVRRALADQAQCDRWRFVWTRVGCGLAGLTDAQMVSVLPEKIPNKAILPPRWLDLRGAP